MLQLRPNNNGFAIQVNADAHGIWIQTDTWTVPIAKNVAKKYATDYLNSTVKDKPNQGFYDHEGKVCLTHNDAKIWLSKQEAIDIIDLINSTYP